MLRDRLQILEKQMELKLADVRVRHQHAVSKGSNMEAVVRDFLREFLPPTHRIGHGEIIDTKGNISSQTDAIITNENHPYLNDLASPSVFFIEGIACVGEVKSALTLDDFEKTLTNCLRFKRLTIVREKGMMVHSSMEDIKRFVERRPFFLFAFESKTSLESIKQRFDAFNIKNNLPVEEQIDGVFVLRQGSAINFGTGKGSLQFRAPSGESVPGLVLRGASEDGSILYSFLSWLSACMPRIQSWTPPILYYLVATQETGKA